MNKIEARPSMEPSLQVINQHINVARDDLLNKAPDIEKSRMTYDIEMNMALYGTLRQFENPASQAYQTARKDLDNQTEFDLITMLGERSNVLLSSYLVDIKPDGLVPRGYSETLLTIVDRGQKLREKNKSNAVDREKAEVMGAQKMQEVFCDPNTPVGTMMVSISPPRIGTIYNKRFHDIFTLKADNNGNKYIEARRYSCSLSVKEYAHKLHELQPDEPYIIPTDVALLSRPIRINPTQDIKTADDVHALFHKQHEYTSREEFEEAINACKPFIHALLNVLAETPDNRKKVAEGFDVAIIKFDRELEGIRKEKKPVAGEVVYKRSDNSISSLPFMQQYNYYKQFEVETVMTGCGISGGARNPLIDIGESESSPFGVMAFGVKKEQTLKKFDEEYGFDDFEPCVGHIMQFNDHAKRYVGPCDLCKSCDEAAKRGKLKKAA